MRVVRSQDVKEMPMGNNPGSTIGRNGWPGVWLEAILDMLRRKTNRSWTDTHRNKRRNVMRKLAVAGGCVHGTEELRAKTSNDACKLQRRLHVVPSQRKQLEERHLSVRKRESEDCRSWNM